MKPDKLTIVRNKILDLLESGEVPACEKLPVTRDLAAATGISLLIVQSAVESLSNEECSTKFRATAYTSIRIGGTASCSGTSSSSTRSTNCPTAKS